MHSSTAAYQLEILKIHSIEETTLIVIMKLSIHVLKSETCTKLVKWSFVSEKIIHSSEFSKVKHLQEKNAYEIAV
jgi:hypothetical protein